MNYLEKREKVIENLNILPIAGIDIYDICLELKMSIDGSADPLSKVELITCIKYLETVLDTWQEGIDRNKEFDNIMKSLVECSLKLTYKYIFDVFIK